MKSKVTARKSTSPSSTQPMVVISGMFDRQPPKHVGYVLSLVGGLLHLLVDVAPLDNVHHIFGVREKLCQAATLEVVGFVFETVDLYNRREYLTKLVAL